MAARRPATWANVPDDLRSMVQLSETERRRLRDAVAERRADRAWTQAQVADRGDLSVDRIQAIESERAGHLRYATLRRLEAGLDWAPGSVLAVIRGETPTEAAAEALVVEAELHALGTIVTVLERMTPAERTRLLKWLVDRYSPTVRLGDGDEP